MLLLMKISGAVPFLLAAWQSDGSQFVDSRAYRAPAGEYTLSVEPSVRSGAGPATYRMERGGVLLWEKVLPVTLIHGGVTDQGWTYGFGDTDGRLATSGETVVWVLSATGDVVHEERMARSVSDEKISLPYHLGIIEWHHAGRFAMRALDRRGDHLQELWMRWCVRTGDRLPDIAPRESVEVTGRQAYRLVGAMGIPGTGMTLVHWLCADFNDPGRETLLGAVISLLDEAGAEVWRLDLAADYSGHTGIERNNLEGWVSRLGAIRVGTAPQEFAVLEYKKGKLRTFGLVRVPGLAGWNVRELGSVDFVLPWSDGATPSLQLPLVSVGSLERPILTGRRRVKGWTARGNCAVELLCRESESEMSVLWLGSDGVIAREQRIELSKSLAGKVVSWRGVQPGHYVGCVVRKGTGILDAVVRLRDIGDGGWDLSEVSVQPYQGRPIRAQSVSSGGSGGVVVLGAFAEDGPGVVRLFGVDGAGVPLWMFGDEARGNFGYDIDDYCVFDGGQVLLLDGLASEVVVLDALGQVARTIALVDGSSPGSEYWCRLRGGVEGVVIVSGISAAAGYLELSLSTGSVRRRAIEGEDGALAAFAIRDMRVTDDGACIVETDSRFVCIDRVGSGLGELKYPTREGWSGVVGIAGVLENGLVFAEDANARRLCFWSEGRDLASVFDASKENGWATARGVRVVAGPLGSAWQIDRDGHGLGLIKGEWVPREFDSDTALAAIADEGMSWSWSRTKEAVIKGRDGDAKSVEIDRRPGGSWLRRVGQVSIAPSGSLAVTEPMGEWPDNLSWMVHFYGADGQPQFSSDVAGLVGQWIGYPTVRNGDRWVVLGASGPRVVLIDKATRDVYRFEPPRHLSVDGIWAHGMSGDGKRLLSMNAVTLQLFEYRLPDA